MGDKSRRGTLAVMAWIVLGICLMMIAAFLPLRTPGASVSPGVFFSLFLSGPTLIGIGLGRLVRSPVFGGLVGFMAGFPLVAAFLLLASG